MSALVRVDNPALEAWTRHYGHGAAYNDYERWHQTRRIDFDRAHDLRREIVTRYCFSVPTDEALDAIGRGPICEIGAGTGYWASLLQRRGVDVVAYDHRPPPDVQNGWYAGRSCFTDVRPGGVGKVRDHCDRTLMLQWPPYGATMAIQALRKYEDGGGHRVIYVGEGAGGCCADDAFFLALGAHWDEELEQTFSLWTEKERIALPQWDGLHDALWIYER